MKGMRNVYTKVLRGSLVTDHAASLPSTLLDQWLVQDKVDLLGAILSVTNRPESAGPAYQEGMSWATAELTRAAKPWQDASILFAEVLYHYWTEIVVADQLGGMFGKVREHEKIMLPSGSAIELVPGGYINLLIDGGTTLLSAGNYYIVATAILFYIER